MNLDFIPYLAPILEKSWSKVHLYPPVATDVTYDSEVHGSIPPLDIFFNLWYFFV